MQFYSTLVWNLILAYGASASAMCTNIDHEECASTAPGTSLLQTQRAKAVPETSASKENLQGSEGGAWSPCTHIKAYSLNMDFGLVQALSSVAESINASSALEFGAGLGLYSSYMSRFGKIQRMFALEPVPMTLPIDGDYLGIAGKGSNFSWVNGNVLDLDQQELSSLGLGQSRRVDVVYSFEVLEHIPKDLHKKALDFLTAHAGKLLVFGAGRPGQAGVGHISNRPAAEYRQEFESRGWHYLEDATAAVRAAACAPNHDVNTMVYARPGVEVKISDALKELGAKKCRRNSLNLEIWPELTKYAAAVQSGKVKCEAATSGASSDVSLASWMQSGSWWTED